MTGIFNQPPDGYVEVPLLESERILHQQTAAALRGKVSVTGGQLVITNQRVLFKALDVAAAIGLLRHVVNFLPDGLGVLGKVIDKSLDHAYAYSAGVSGAIDTAAVRRAEPGMRAALGHPPSLLLTLGSGTVIEIGILHKVSSPNFSSANNTDRDRVVALINSLLARNGMV